MVRIARYLGICRSLDSSIEEPKRYELPAGDVRGASRWLDRLGWRRDAVERAGAGVGRFRDSVIRSGGRILF